jgi:hypothetical protein
VTWPAKTIKNLPKTSIPQARQSSLQQSGWWQKDQVDA